MSVNNSGEFNNFILSKGGNMPSVPQNTPACSSFSDRMMLQMNLKNIKGIEGAPIGEKDAVVKNLSSRLMSLSGMEQAGPGEAKRVLTREEAMLELQWARLEHLVMHLEQLNLINKQWEDELSPIYALQGKLISGGHVNLGNSNTSVEDGIIPDFWPIVLGNIAIPCVGETELKLFEFVTDLTAEYLPANVDGIRSFLSKLREPSATGAPEWPSCDEIPGSYGPGIRVTFCISPNNIIMCPSNKLSIELRFDIEAPSVVTHVRCSRFTRIDGSKPAVEPGAEEPEAEEGSDLNLLELMEIFFRGIDMVGLDDSDKTADFYMEAAEQLNNFCDTIKARVIPYASQIYFVQKSVGAEEDEEAGEDKQ